MQSGNLSFNSLFDYIKQHKVIPHKNEPAFVGFKNIYLQLVRNIADIPGWYAWIKKSNGNTDIVYIGQSQSRKTANLQARLKEEFLDEFVALWATIWNAEEIVKTLDNKYRGKYTAPIKRAARKAGSTHIVWFGKRGLTDRELDVVEHALIAKYSPLANKQSRSHSDSLDDLLGEADATMQNEIRKL